MIRTSHKPVGVMDVPLTGLYKLRLARNAPWLPTRIWMAPAVDPLTGEQIDRPSVLSCTVAGKDSDPYWAWTSCAGHPIDAEEYRYLTKLLAWAESVGAARDRTVDLNRLPPVY
jgi:hypothetical protein